MGNIKRKWDLLSDTQRNDTIKLIIEYFDTIKKEGIGIISAGELLDQFLQTIGLELYNKGVEDSLEYLSSRMEDIKIDMETLLKK